MSHYNEHGTTIKDEECLIAALQKVDCPANHKFTRTMIEVHDKPQNLQGYDDTKRRQAHIIIRRGNAPGSYNDIGFLKNGDTYEALISDQYDQRWLGRLTNAYNLEVSKKAFAQKGFNVVETKAPDGRVRLIATKRPTVNTKIQMKVGL